MIITALGYAALVWVLVSWAKIWITPKMPIYKYMCLKCLTFWSTLAITLDPFAAATAALIAMVIDTYQNNINITL